MLNQIFDTLNQVKELQENKGDDKKFFRECVAGKKIGVLHVENIHPETRDTKSIFISVKVDEATYSFEGCIEKNVLYFKQVAVPRSIFRENFLISILIEILKIVRDHKIDVVVCRIEESVYFKRMSVPFRLCGFTRSKGITGDFYSFTADFSKFLK